MSRTILYERHGQEVALGARYIATRIFDEVIGEYYKKDPKRFSGDEQEEIFVKPFLHNSKEKIYGLTMPLGLPVWDTTKKEYQNRFFNKLNKGWNRDFKEIFTILPAAIKESEDEDIQSFIKWKDKNARKRLAIVFMGILWFYKDDQETLNEASKRFYDAHPEFQERLNYEMKKKYMLGNESRYTRAIFSSGALLFQNKKAIIRCQFFRDPSAVIWSTLIIKGYMPWIKEIQYISERDFDTYIK